MRPLFALVLLVFPIVAESVLADDARPARGLPDGVEVRRDIPYVTGANIDPKQRLDVWFAREAKNQPVVVYIHGGGWRIGDKAHVAQKPLAFSQRGFVLVSIDYRLHPAADFRDQASDIAHALRYVVEHAAEFGGDPAKIFLMGHSAGAHLAALVATDESYLKTVGLPLSTIHGVVLLDGAGYDIPRQIQTVGRAASEQLYTTIFSRDVAVQREASPITHVAAGKGIPPFLILPVGERPDSTAQSNALAEKLRAAGVEATVTPCFGQTHASINQQFGTAGHQATDAAFRFFAARQKELEASTGATPAAESTPATSGPVR